MAGRLNGKNAIIVPTTASIFVKGFFWSMFTPFHYFYVIL